MKYSTRLLGVLLGISFLFLGGAQGFGQEWSAEQKEVLKMEEVYWDLLKAGDLKGYMELWHKDFIGWPHWAKKPIGREIIEKGTIPWYKFVRSYDLQPLAIKIYDKIAVIYYRLSWTGTENRAFSGRMGHIWMKQDGKWQIIGGYSGGGNTQE